MKASARKALLPVLRRLRRSLLGVLPRPRPKAARWNKSLPPDFDVAAEGLSPSTLEFEWASRWVGVPVKRLFVSPCAVPGARLGSFLTGLRHALADAEVRDTRNLGGRDGPRGYESPPLRRTIELNSTSRDDFLIDGTEYRVAPWGRLAVKYEPCWSGVEVTVYVGDDNAARARAVVDRAWEWARVNNFLKGEAFALSGEFLPRTAEGWDDVFLEDRNKTALRRVVGRLNARGKDFANRGMIFLGPPGTGKTLSGRIIRNTAEASFIWVSSRDFHMAGSFGGIALGFELARELAPSVLFVEDVDNWLHETTIDLVKTEMDGIQRSSGVLTILTTNFPERLPAALIDRPGRFHDVLRFDLPDDRARAEMLAKWLADADADDVARAVAATAGYSGAHVFELAQFARHLAEEDGLLPSEAVGEAIAKVAEQRELIEQSQLAGSRYRARPAARPSRRALLAAALLPPLRRLAAVLPRLKGDFNEQDHPRADDGKFGGGGGSGAGGKPAGGGGRKGPGRGDEISAGYVDAFNDPEGGPATAAEAATANAEMEADGSEYRVVPREGGGWEAVSAEELGDQYGDDWEVRDNPLTGKPDVASAAYFDDLESIRGDDLSASYVASFNDTEGGEATQEEADQANRELREDGSEYRITWSDDNGRWEAVPAEDVDGEDDDPEAGNKGRRPARSRRGRRRPKGDFNEQDHPRADDGKFGGGGGGAGKKPAAGGGKVSPAGAGGGPVAHEAGRGVMAQLEEYGVVSMDHAVEAARDGLESQDRGEAEAVVDGLVEHGYAVWAEDEDGNPTLGPAPAVSPAAQRGVAEYLADNDQASADELGYAAADADDGFSRNDGPALLDYMVDVGKLVAVDGEAGTAYRLPDKKRFRRGPPRGGPARGGARPKGDFREDDHPRDDGGKFGSGGGAGKPSPGKKPSGEGGGSAGPAAERAAQASAGVIGSSRQADDRSEQAEDASNLANATGRAGDHREAAAAHKEAMHEHARAAREAHARGDDDVAEGHRDAASAHQDAMDAHAGAARAAGKERPAGAPEMKAGGLPEDEAGLHHAAKKAAKGWLARAGEVPGKVLAKARDKVKGYYDKLGARYGKKWAVGIIAAGVVGVPIPLPGSFAMTAAPVLAAAELYRHFAGAKGYSLDDPADVARMYRLAKKFWGRVLADWAKASGADGEGADDDAEG